MLCGAAALGIELYDKLVRDIGAATNLVLPLGVLVVILAAWAAKLRRANTPG